MKSEHTLAILVANQPGALTKIAGTFFRRGYNIETMTVYKTHIKDLTKILISGQAEDRDAEHLRRQIENMVDVQEARLLDRSQSITSEMCLVQLGFETDAERREIITVAAPYGAKIKNVNGKSIILEMVSTPDIVDDFVSMLCQYNMMDISRTGMTMIGPSLPPMQRDFATDQAIVG